MQAGNRFLRRESFAALTLLLTAGSAGGARVLAVPWDCVARSVVRQFAAGCSAEIGAVRR